MIWKAYVSGKDLITLQINTQLITEWLNGANHLNN